MQSLNSLNDVYKLIKHDRFSQSLLEKMMEEGKLYTVKKAVGGKIEDDDDYGYIPKNETSVLPTGSSDPLGFAGFLELQKTLSNIVMHNKNLEKKWEKSEEESKKREKKWEEENKKWQKSQEESKKKWEKSEEESKKREKKWEKSQEESKKREKKWEEENKKWEKSQEENKKLIERIDNLTTRVDELTTRMSKLERKDLLVQRANTFKSIFKYLALKISHHYPTLVPTEDNEYPKWYNIMDCFCSSTSVYELPISNIALKQLWKVYKEILRLTRNEISHKEVEGDVTLVSEEEHAFIKWYRNNKN